MSKIQCKCGNVIAISGQIPNPNELLIISDSEFDSLREGNEIEALYLKMKSAFICNECKRVWFFDSSDSTPISYKKEDN